MLKIGVKPINTWISGQSFYAKMGKDGRVLIPKLILTLLVDEKPNPEGYVMEVSLEPT